VADNSSSDGPHTEADADRISRREPDRIGRRQPDQIGRRERRGWEMYDWAWSAYSTTVATTLAGPYLFELAKPAGGVGVLGFTVAPASFFPLAASASAVLQVLFLPLLGAVADHTAHTKRLMMGLAYLASTLLVGFYFVTSSTVLLGGVLFAVAAALFGAASVLYNAYLPEIAEPDERDALSARGYAWGYLGGGLWLAANLALITLLDNDGLAVRLSLAGTGLWCVFFFWLYPGRLLKPRPARRRKPDSTSWLALSTGSVVATLRSMARQHRQTLRYLVAYLLFIDGTVTVTTVASSFARDELNAPASTLLLLSLVVQFTAVPGALLFGRLAGRVGSKTALQLNLGLWTALVVYAFAALDTIAQLWLLGVVLGVAVGGSLTLSRSLYSQLIPTGQEAEYFGFFEIAARGTAWLGPLTFALVNQAVGSQRLAISSLIVFLVLGMAILATVDVEQGRADAVGIGNTGRQRPN
jgi:UMF1 family MFS transporter